MNQQRKASVGQSRDQQQLGCLSLSSIEYFCKCRCHEQMPRLQTRPCSEHTFLSSMLPISSMIVMASAMICRQPDNSGQVTANTLRTSDVCTAALICTSGHRCRGPR